MSAKKNGRPSSFTQEIGDEICERIGLGESMIAICEDGHMPNRKTVIRWLADDRYATFRLQYARAREVQADTYLDEIREISRKSKRGIKTVTRSDGTNTTVETTETDAVDRARLQIDALKWTMSKLAPKKYGEKVTNVLEGGERAIPLDVSVVDPAEASRAYQRLIAGDDD